VVTALTGLQTVQSLTVGYAEKTEFFNSRQTVEGNRKLSKSDFENIPRTVPLNVSKYINKL
jgi:hypothetical protein